MPISSLRLINPPGRRRKKPFPKYASSALKKRKKNPKTRRKAVAKATGIRRVKTPSGTRYMRGGKFVKSSVAKAALKRKRTAKKKRNPGKSASRASSTGLKRRRRGVSTARRRTSVRAALASNPRRKATKRKATTSAKRRAAARKAARTRAAKAAARSAAAKKAARTRKRRAAAKVRSNPSRRKKVARKRTTKRRTRRAVRRNPMSKRKLRAKAKRQPRYKSGPKKGKFKPSRKRKSTKRRASSRRRTTKRRSTRRRTSRQTVYLRKKPSARKLSRYKVRRTRRKSSRGRTFYRYGLVRQNPMKTLKKVLPLYGGILASRVLTGLVKRHVVDRFSTQLGALGPVLNFLPSAGTLLLSTMLLPKVLKGKKRALLEGIQMGAAITLLDVGTQKLVDMLPATMTGEVKSIALNAAGSGLGSYDDMGVQGYGGAALGGGYGSYMSDPTGYNLPAVRSAQIASMGLDVQEAMALDEYIPGNAMGDYSVEEALAGSEGTYLQEGGAGGSLRGSVFRS